MVPGKVKEACRNVLNKREEKTGSIIETAKNYIKNNYHKDISLDDVSREVNISPYYFSKLFKETTGENFIEYLTNLRMDKAKGTAADDRVLHEGDLCQNRIFGSQLF